MPEFLFKFVGNCPLPVFDTDHTGTVRKADGKTLFSLRQAARKSGRPAKDLRDLASASIAELMPTLPSGEDLDGRGDGLAGSLATRDDATGDDARELIGKFTPDQLTLESFKRQFCHNFDDAHVADALAVCRARDLNPFRQEICFKLILSDVTKRLEVIAITKIAGLRHLAARNPRYGTQTPPLFCGPDGQWLEVWPEESTPPYACKKGIIKEGCEPQVAIAYWHEYAPGEPDDETGEVVPVGDLWTKKGLTALAKCAEAIALRQAYPAELAGVYIEEEVTTALQRTEAAKARQRKRQENPDAHEIWQGDEDRIPQTLSQLKLALVNQLELSQADADYRIAHFKQLQGRLLQRSEAQFCAWAFRRARETEARKGTLQPA